MISLHFLVYAFDISLLPTDLISYIVLQSKVNGKSYSGKDDLGGHGINKKASVLRGNDSSHTSDFGDVPFEADKKEKFKMIIGKSRKEEHDTERGTQENGVTVDAAAAVAILQAATRGIKNSDSHNHINRSEGGADSSESNLTEEQKRKAERLKKAKMFVAMLKSGAGPDKPGTSRGPSVEPLESGVLRLDSEVNLNNHEREGSLPPAVVNKPVGTIHLGERQLSKRKYRSKIGEDSDREEHEEYEIDKGRHRSRSSERNKNRGESSEEDRHHKRCKTKHLSHHSQQENDGYEGIHKEERDGKHKRKHKSRSRRYKEDDDIGNAVEKERKHRRRRRSRSRSSSEESENEEESNKEEKDGKRDREIRRSRDRSRRSKKHRSHRSKHRHRSRDKESRHRHKHDSTSDDERGELEEGEISSKVEEESRGITNDDRVEVITSSRERAPSQPSDNTDIPADFRAKIRAMLMATQS